MPKKTEITPTNSAREPFLRSFFLLFTLTFVSNGLRGEPIDVEEYLPLLPEKVIQVKIGTIVGNDVFSYDDLQTVQVIYPEHYNKDMLPWRLPPTSPVEHKILQWFAGDLTTKIVRQAQLPTRIGTFKTEQIKNTEFCLQWDDERVQRWGYKDNAFWCIPERVVQFQAGFPNAGAYNELFPALYRTGQKEELSVKLNDDGKQYGNNNRDDIERLEWTPAISQSLRVQTSVHRSSSSVDFQCLSTFPPMQRLNPCYDYLSGGFDFMPISHNHWQLCTLIPHYGNQPPYRAYFPFTLWEAHSRAMERGSVNGYETKWQVRSQLLLAWGGKFFAVPIKNAEDGLPKFHLVRDSSPCHRLVKEHIADDLLQSYSVSGELYRLEVIVEDMINENHKPWHEQWGGKDRTPSEWDTKKIHCEKAVLDPKEHRIIVLIYVEPEGEVYGFGKDFYVRLDVLPENGDLTSAIVPCRDITAGEVRGFDHTDQERIIGEPFRTVWQAALVLRESQ